MPKNSNQNKRIKSERRVGEPEIKGRDQIWEQCQKTKNKRKGSNLGAMQDINEIKKEGIEFGRDARKPE